MHYVLRSSSLLRLPHRSSLLAVNPLCTLSPTTSSSTATLRSPPPPLMPLVIPVPSSSAPEVDTSPSPPETTPAPPPLAVELSDSPRERASNAEDVTTRSGSPSGAEGAGSPLTTAEVGTGSARAQDKGKGKEDEKDGALDRFSCHICLDLPEQPVLTPCGHIFCWPCMHEWLVVANGRACPVCKTALTQDRLIPIYSSSEGAESDPRKTPIPPRPSPAATPSASSFARPPSAFGSIFSSSSWTVSAGVFPLPGLAMSYQWPPQQTREAGPPPVDVWEERARLGLMGEPHAVGAGMGVEQEQMRTFAQQAFLLLFVAVFLAMTFSG